MFEFARWVVRNKVVCAGLVATLYILFGGNGAQQKPASAWAASAPESGAGVKVAYGDQAGAAGGATTTGERALHVISGAVKTVGADKLLPEGVREKTIDNWSNTEKSVRVASGEN